MESAAQADREGAEGSCAGFFGMKYERITYIEIMTHTRSGDG